jgi:MobA/MobL family
MAAKLVLGGFFVVVYFIARSLLTFSSRIGGIMALFYFNRCYVKRDPKCTRLCVAGLSAYHSAQRVQTYKGKIIDFTDKEGVLFSEIGLPPDTPAWAASREELWRRLELRNYNQPRHAKAISAHNIVGILPEELTIEQNVFLVRDFVREHFLKCNLVADWSIHAADPRGDQRNIHVHILVPLRKIEKGSFGLKEKCWGWKLREEIVALRKGWATVVNRHLERWHHKARIDHRSLRAQGINRPPLRRKSYHRPRLDRKTMDALRAKVGPLPLAPIIQLSRKLLADGTISIRASVRRSALNALQNPRAALPAPVLPARTWSEFALKEWNSWGRQKPSLFYAIWQDLAPKDFSVGAGPCP